MATVIEITRDIPVAVDAAFAWLTDFREEDAQLAGAVVKKREILERGKDRVVYRGETETLGRASWAVTEVTLRPPARWEARVTDGPRTGSVTEYALVPRGAGSQLRVRYQFAFLEPKTRFLFRLAKPLVRRELGRMWDGYVAAMARDLRGA